LKKHNNSAKKSEPTSRRTKARGPVQRDTKEVLAELVGKLKEKLDRKKVAATSAEEKHQRGELRPNLDRLTVGVDLGDQWSHYCILGLEGETLAEGQLRTTPQDFAEFFEALNGAHLLILSIAVFPLHRYAFYPPRRQIEVKVFLEAIAMQRTLYAVCSFLLLIRGERRRLWSREANAVLRELGPSRGHAFCQFNPSC
jgi:hypothetical protein